MLELKLVRERRGGNAIETNLLLALALRALKFTVIPMLVSRQYLNGRANAMAPTPRVANPPTNPYMPAHPSHAVP
eukprot:scaffold24919_cov34-Tisochrysis_lutea.AAC.4